MPPKSSTKKSAKSLWNAFPLIVGTILLVSLITTIIPKSFYLKIFSKSTFLDSFIGSLIGSISAGNPIVSYVLAGELLNEGISLVAVTAFFSVLGNSRDYTTSCRVRNTREKIYVFKKHYFIYFIYNSCRNNCINSTGNLKWA